MKIVNGDSLLVLLGLPDESVNCCVTSPPYYGLRDYGCTGQIGLEKTPEEFISKLVEVFREVRRVLRSDGTCWVNIGDSYANDGKWGGSSGGKHVTALHGNSGIGRQKQSSGLKPKDLIGIPWMLAFALRSDGWYLRQDIIWHKPNPMPESVRDRCTKAHEYVFLLTKSERYACDMAAVKEPISKGDAGSLFTTGKTGEHQLGRAAGRPKGNAKTFRGGGAYTQGQSFDNSAVVERESHGNEPNESGLRNKRSVWTMATQPTPDAHFATFPLELPETCILAGCPEGGTVIDPFSGAGTTGLAAIKHGRKYIGIELNPKYIAISNERMRRHMPLMEEEIFAGAE